MYSPLILLSFFALALTQSCGFDPSVCTNNSLCLYQTGVDTCMQQILPENSNFTLSNTSVNYFYWRPEKDHYNLNFYISNLDDVDRTLKLGVYLQDDNGTGYPQEMGSTVPQGVNKSWMITFTNVDFCKTPLGVYCLLIIGYRLTSDQPVNIQMSIREATRGVDLFLPIMIGVGIVMFTMLVTLVICIVRRRMLRNSLAQQDREHDLSHFDTYLPKMQLKELREKHVTMGQIEDCPVCMNDMLGTHFVRKTMCGHVFHIECLESWCKTNLICPMCREGLDQDNLRTKTQQRSNNVDDSSMHTILNKHPSATEDNRDIQLIHKPGDNPQPNQT